MLNKREVFVDDAGEFGGMAEVRCVLLCVRLFVHLLIKTSLQSRDLRNAKKPSSQLPSSYTLVLSQRSYGYGSSLCFGCDSSTTCQCDRVVITIITCFSVRITVLTREWLFSVIWL
jgi:hypothetical protein